MKRFIKSMLVTGIAASLILAGCGNKNANSGSSSTNDESFISDESSTNDESATNSETSGDKPSGELVYWAQEYCQKCLQASMDEFKELYPDITFKTEIVPNNELLNKLMLAFSSGEGIPDICTFSTWYMPTLIETGQLLDVTDRIQPYVSDINKMSLQQVQKDGKYYAVPLDASPVGIIYNTTIFEQAGLDTEPEKVSELLSTWDKYIEVGKIIREKTGAGMMTVSSESPDTNFINTLMLQQEAWFNDASGNLTFNIPETRKTLELVVEMRNAGILEDITSWTQPWYDAFNNHKVAAYIGEVWMGGFMADSICPDTKGEWRVVPMPAWEEGGLRTSDSCGSSWFISSTTSNPDAAWAAMEYFTLNQESVLKQYEAMDQFPTYEKVYTDDFFNEPVEFFGGQPVRSVFAELEQSIPASDINFSKNFELYRTQMQTCLQKIVLNNTPIDQAIEETEKEISAQMQ